MAATGPSGNDNRPAFDGVLVCDFSWVGAGPRATKELADNGATVVKIESRERVDLTRRTPPFKGGTGPDNSSFFVMSNTSKKSITLNLSNPKAVDIARRLALKSDLVVENFGKGFMERMGLDYESLKKLKPDVAMVSVSITGRTGPLANFKGYGNSAAATSGQAALTGFPDSAPYLTNYAFGDVVTPLFASIAMVGALEYRRRTGKGIYVDIAQLESMMHLLAPAALDHFSNGTTPGALGNRSTWCSPNGVFPCVGDDQWCAVTAKTDAEWKSLARIIGGDALVQDTRFASPADRKSNEDALEDLISAWTRTREKELVMSILCEAGVPAGTVQNGREVYEDPQLAHRQIATKINHPEMGPVDHNWPAFKLSDTPANVTHAPLLGADTEVVLKTILGIGDTEYATLEQEGVLQ